MPNAKNLLSSKYFTNLGEMFSTFYNNGFCCMDDIVYNQRKYCCQNFDIGNLYSYAGFCGNFFNFIYREFYNLNE